MIIFINIFICLNLSNYTFISYIKFKLKKYLKYVNNIFIIIKFYYLFIKQINYDDFFLFIYKNKK